ncbi:MAG: thiol reductant ABC exporter subunit CydD [Alicyclobacillus sp.]|nr:thiol reductant ABC exporter subunit CydD [Alicyclobacillus sp.]
MASKGPLSPTEVRHTERQIRRWLHREVGGLRAAAGLRVLAQGVGVAQAWVMAHVFTQLWQGHLGLRLLWLGGMGVLLAGAVRSCLFAAADGWAGRQAVQALARLRQQVYAAATAPGRRHLAQTGHSEWLAAALHGVDELEPYLAQYLPQRWAAGAACALTWAAIAWADPLSALWVACSLPLLPLFGWLTGRAAQARAYGQWLQMQRLTEVTWEALRGLRTLFLFGRAHAQAQRLAAVSEAYRQAANGVLRWTFLSSLVLELLTALATALVAVGLGLRLVHGQQTLSAALLALLLTPECFAPVRQAAALFHASASGLAAAQQLGEVLDQPAAAAAAGRVRLPARPGGVRVELTGVGVRHPEGGWILQDVTLHLEPGEVVALVGPSGAGKTTLLHLLLGLVAADVGEVRVDGVPLADVDLTAWRRQVAYVAQRPYPFPGDALATVRWANPALPPAAVRAALRWAGVDPAWGARTGFRSVGEQARCSGGQVQRLAWARARLHGGRLVLLDEPTAALDVSTEALLTRRLRDLLRGRTGVLVAHRLTTALLADRVVVLQQGRVVQSGLHHVLLREEGLYRTMWQVYTAGDKRGMSTTGTSERPEGVAP